MEIIYLSAILPLGILLLLAIRDIKKKKKLIEALSKELQVANTKNHTQLLPSTINKRKNFRVDVFIEDAILTFTSFGDPTLNKLVGKMSKVFIENLSATGAKIQCDFNLPVRKGISITLNFKLINENFCLPGKMVRKEEFNECKFNYGIEFKIPKEDKEKLYIILNAILIEKEKNVL